MSIASQLKNRYFPRKFTESAVKGTQKPNQSKVQFSIYIYIYISYISYIYIIYLYDIYDIYISHIYITYIYIIYIIYTIYIIYAIYNIYIYIYT